MEDLALGDTGFLIVFTIEEDGTAVDISTATNMKVYFRTPTGDVIEKSGALNTTGTDGKMKYTDDGLIPISKRELVGNWSAEARCTIGTWSGTSTSIQFKVRDVLRRT